MSVIRVDPRIVFGKVATINSQSTLPFQACADFKGESHFLRRLRYGGSAQGGGRAAESHYTSALWGGDKADMFRATLGTVQGGRQTSSAARLPAPRPDRRTFSGRVTPAFLKLVSSAAEREKSLLKGPSRSRSKLELHFPE